MREENSLRKKRKTGGIQQVVKITSQWKWIA